MKHRLAAFRRLILCVLFIASSLYTAEAAEYKYDCFPPDSVFEDIDCTCDGRSSDDLTLDCLTNDVLEEFPVLNSTYPGVTTM